jgi:hypothetical protein
MIKSLTELRKVLQGVDSELLTDTDTHRMRVRVKSETSNATYIVSHRETDIEQWECGCRGWTMTFPRKHCKHLRAMVPVLEEAYKLLYSKPKLIEKKTSKKTVKKNSTKVSMSKAKKK